jgi:hypothetical protein
LNNDDEKIMKKKGSKHDSTETKIIIKKFAERNENRRVELS